MAEFPPRGQHPRQFAMGDIVWVHVKGFPWWPGQVMGMSQVSEKMKEDKQPHTKPISTFGDGQYCWALPLNILKFEERHPCYKVPKRLALSFKQAMEEAKEIVAKRSGSEPATNHEPLDFLNPPKGASLAVREQEKGWMINAPEPPTAQQIADMVPQRIIDQLHELACNPGQGLHKKDVFARYVYSWRHARFAHGKAGRGSAGVQRGVQEQEDASPSDAHHDELIGGDALGQKGKRKRGRPKKERSNTNAKKPEAEEEEEIISDMEAAVENDDAKDSAHESQVLEEESAEDVDLEDEEEQKPKKRKYTRRKQADVSSQEIDSETQWTKLTGGDIRAALKFLSRLAINASSNMQLLHPSYASSRAYLLLLKEKTSARSSWQRLGTIGPLAALAATEAILQDGKQEAKPQRSSVGKIAQGIPVETPEIGDTARYKEYADKVPESAAAFQEKLEAFYNALGKSVASPTVDKQQLDLYCIFKAVANLGGYESVTFNRQWAAVGRKWRDNLSAGGRVSIPKKYIQHLLAYENSLTEGAPNRELNHAARPAAQRGGRPPKLKAQKALKKSTESREESSDDDQLPDTEDAPEAEREMSPDDDDNFRPATKHKTSSWGPEQDTGSKEPKAKRLKSQQESEPKAVRKEVDHAAFDSLEGDNAGPSSSQSTVPKQTSRKPAGLEGKEPKPVLSSKPLAEQKRVIRLMFRKGMEMPSRSRLCAEMKKYGQVMDIQQLNKQNAYLFAYADETNATEAKLALESKAHHILRISKDSIAIFQEQPMIRRAPPSKPNNVGSADSVLLKQPVQSLPLPLQPSPKSQPAPKANGLGGGGGSGTGVPGRPNTSDFNPRNAAVAPLASHPSDPRVIRQIVGVNREAPTDPRQQALPDPRLQGRSIAQISPNLDPRRNPVPAAPAQFAGPRQHARPSGPPSYPRPQQNVPIGQGLDPRTGHPVGPGFVQGLDPRQRAQAPGQEQRHHSTASAPQQASYPGPAIDTSTLISILQNAQGSAPQGPPAATSSDLAAAAGNVQLPAGLALMLKEAGVNPIKPSKTSEQVGPIAVGKPGVLETPQLAGDGSAVGPQLLTLMQQFQ